MKLFNRLYKLTVYRPDGRSLEQPLPFVDSNQDFFEELKNGLEITNMRVTFEVERSLTKDPNTAVVRIYNLAERTRAIFQQSPLTVKLDAGHDGVLRNVLLANVRPPSESLYKRTEWETKLLLKDGGRAYAHARVNRTYKSGTPVRQIVTDCASSLGLTLPRTLQEDSRLNERIPYGDTLEGFARDELERLLAPYGYDWSVQNGQLQALQDDQVREGTERIINKQVAGLIGTPEYGPPNKKSGQRMLKFQCVLYPELVPGSRVRIESRSATGSHKILKVRHEGDSRGPEWTTTCEARAL